LTMLPAPVCVIETDELSPICSMYTSLAHVPDDSIADVISIASNFLPSLLVFIFIKLGLA